MTIIPAFALLLTLLSQAPEIPPSHQRTITLRLLDGRNGKPLKTDEVEVWIDKEQTHVLTVHTAPNGVATVEIPSTTSGIYVTAREDGWFMYRCDADEKKPTPAYSIERIISSGTVAANRCSRRTAAAEPGSLTVFLRPLTFWDKMES